MKINVRFIHVFLGTLAIAVLGGLFNVIRINNPERETWLLSQTHQITVLNGLISQELWRYQSGNASNFDTVAQYAEKMKQARTALQEGDYPVSDLDDAQLKTLLDELEAKLATKEQHINDFFVMNTTLKKSIDFTRRQITDLQKPTKATAQLEQELYYAAYLSVADQNSSLQNTVKTVSQDIVSFPVNQQFFVEQIVSQVNEILEKNRAIYQVLNEITLNSQNSVTQDFENSLHAYFKVRQQTTFYIQSFLFVVSILSIIYAIYLLIKLSRKESALKVALSDIENLQYAFDQHAIISFSDAAGNFTRVNEKFCTLSEYSEAELIGKNHWAIYAGENREAIYLDMVEKTSHGEAWHGELQSKTNTGKTYWVNATIIPFMNNNNELYQIIAINTDITLSKRLEQQNIETRNFIQKLTDTMTQGVFAMDKHGLCSFWNKQAEHLLGWSKRDIFMRSVQELIVFEDDGGNQLDFPAALHSDQTLTIEGNIRCKNGISLPVSLTVAPLQENSKIIGLVVVFQDISDLKEQQRLLNEAMQAAESANQTKSAFLANMSHEIRTPMNGIIGMTDLALDTQLTEEQREFLNIAKNSANALLTIINDILDFSKIEAGKLELDAFEFDLHQSVRETLKNLSVRACQKGLEMILDVEPNAPRFLIGDAGRLGQIIINLVGNAIKFTEVGEIIIRIRLLTQQDDQTCLQFFVEDSGIGIPEDRQKDVFSSFSQVDATVFRKYGGTGLGLTIAKQLVELMRGHIGLTSQVGKGTSFHFTVWFKNSTHEFHKVTPLPTLKSMGVYLVDNNEKMRQLIANSLVSWGMDVSAFADAADMLNAIDQAKLNSNSAPKLIIVDEDLGDTNGFEVVEHIQRNKLSSAPIIMLLSSVYSASKVRNSSAKFACVISKPASQSDLLDAVHTVFGGPVLHSLVNQDQSAQVKQLQPLNILVAEDNAINQQLAIRLLEKQHHRVTIANNGQECLDKLAQENFDLVLMDFQMPVMDGLEATRRLRAQGFTLPVIAMTANAMKGDRERAIESGMIDYLTKPIKVHELFDVLGRYFPELDAETTAVKPVLALENTAEPAPAPTPQTPELTLEVSEPEQALPKALKQIQCDWKAALALLGEDEEILINMAELYIGNHTDYLKDIHAALTAQDNPKLTRALHSLKGTFALFQATEAEQVLAKAEHAAHDDQVADVLAVLPQIEAFVLALADYLSEKLDINA